METRARTLVKALIWQFIGLTVMALVGWVVTGSAMIGGTLAGINTALGFLTYILYERAWAHVRWGRQGSGLAQRGDT